MKYVFILCFAGGVLFGQTNSEANVNFSFNFNNPGARSMGLAGAFSGYANDPTAVIANPAGLMQLPGGGFALEINAGHLDNEIPFYGGTIIRTNIHEYEYNLESRTFAENSQEVRFFSYVKAIGDEDNPSGMWSFFYHRQANMHRNFNTDGIELNPTLGSDPGVVPQVFPFYKRIRFGYA